MNDLVVWLVTGAVVGWLASTLMRAGSGLLLLNLLFGMAGALMAGWWALPWMAGQQSLATVETLAVVSLGAALMLVLVNVIPVLLLRRRHLR